MTQHFDVAVIGGGIVGLAHAWMAARRGLQVLLLERSAIAEGASVRNFGMIWPIGQPAGELHAVALRSRDFWLELHSQGVIDLEECGSIHLAHREDEQAVLEEFRDQQSHDVRLLSAEEIMSMAPLANPNNLLSGLFSHSELRVDPRRACGSIAAWLTESLSVECCFKTLVTRTEGHVVHAADGRMWKAERIIVCSGSDLQTLYGDILQRSGLVPCKLQMLKTVTQPPFQTQSPHLASGLTLRHYAAFGGCPSLPKLQARIAAETPELDRFGIHVMASPCASGEVILGDSHEYGAEITPFDKGEIDELILRELRKVIRLSDWTIQQRWHGVYTKHLTLPVFEAESGDGVQIFVGTGGAGMTMAFGLADRAWKQWTGEAT